MSAIAERVAAPQGWTRSPLGLLVPATAQRYDRPVGIDFFAGAGGFSCGMHQAGVHVAAAVEMDPQAAITYLVNLARPGVKIHFDTPEREEKFTAAVERHCGLGPKGWRKERLTRATVAGDGWISHQPPSERGCEHFWVADVRNLTGAQILAELGLERGEPMVVFGGPPCQGFSAAGKRNVMNPRNSLVFEFARLVIEIWPKTFVMENVPAMATMLTPEGVPVIDALARVMADASFSAYDALKASLAAQSGRAGLLRRDKAARRKGKAAREPEPEPEDDGYADEQLDLFGLDVTERRSAS